LGLPASAIVHIIQSVPAPVAYLSPRGLARAVGVSESSVKRWADEGALRTVRTAGGHRRIPVADAIRFVRDSRLDLLHPESLGLPVMPVGAPAGSAEGFEALLLEGRSAEAIGVLVAAYMDGASVAALCDGPIRHAMGHIGELWREREDGVFVEHQATAICMQAMWQLRALQPAPDGGARAVGGAVAGDASLLPSLMAATVLAAEGFHATNLGADTPVRSLLDGVAAHDPSLVWLSVNHPVDPEELRDYVDQLVGGLDGRDVQCVVGGREAAGAAVPPSPRLLVVSSMAELAALARGMRA
jgi:excisionase family DNA binding protein